MITCARCGRENADDARFCSNCGNGLVSSPAATGEVRKTVTVMFMDAVGSTAAGEQTDPESLRRVMTRYFDEIRAIVERHGGTVEKYIGDAVMAVFGVPVVHEDDALRAARAAIEIRSRLAVVSDDLLAQRGAAVSWRTGINTGEVVAGDAGAGQRFVSGDAVNTAARLEQAAAAAEILLGNDTYRLIRDGIRAEPADSIYAKGKAEPVVAYRLIDVTATSGQTARGLDSPMVGRERPQRLLAEAFDQAVHERVCHLFTILGPAGVGKSRLVSEFLAGVGGEARSLHGRCLSYGEGITYWPILEAIRDAAGLSEGMDDDAIRARVGALVDDDRDRPVVVERVGQLMGRFGGDASREETFWAVRTLLESLCRRQPVILTLDDIHWAEPTLLDLIENLADWMRDAPLLLLCVARRELLEARPDWGGGKSSATTISLEPLNEGESRELIANLLGQMELSADLVDKIGSAAEGNPLFVEEMVAMLIDRGYLERRSDGWVAVTNIAEVTVPPTIQALLSARLDGLPQPERDVIGRGAVEGSTFHRGAVAELAPAELRQSIPEHLRALSRKELVRPDRSDFAGDEAFRFRHMLFRDAAYSAMPKEMRADLHARFAGWLERVAAGHVAEYEEILAYHLQQAYRYRKELGAADDETLALASEAGARMAVAGERAGRRGDVRGAIKLLESAVDLLPADDPARFRAIASLAATLSLAGELHRADDLLATAIEEARSTGNELALAQLEVVRLDPQSILGKATVAEVVARSAEYLQIFERHGDEWGIDRATYELGRHYFFGGHAQLALDLLAAHIARLAPKAAPAMTYGFMFAGMYWGPTPVMEAMKRAGALDVSTSRALEATQLRVLGGLNGLIGEFDLGRQQLHRSMEIEREIGRDALAKSIRGHQLGPLEHLAENLAVSEEILRTSYEEMSATGDLAFSATTATNLASVYVDLGRPDEAERYARIAVETSVADDAAAQGSGRASIARVLADRGQIDAAEKMAREAVAIAVNTDYLALRGEAWRALAEVMLAAGMRAEAAAAAQESIDAYDSKGATVLADKARRRFAEADLVTG